MGFDPDGAPDLLLPLGLGGEQTGVEGKKNGALGMDVEMLALYVCIFLFDVTIKVHF